MVALLEKWIGDSLASKWAILVFISFLIATLIKVTLKLFLFRFKKIAEKTEADWDDIVVGCLERLKHWVLLVWVFYTVTRSLSKQTVLEKPFQIVVAASCVVQFGRWTQYILRYWRSHILDKKISENPSAAAALGLSYRIVQAVAFALILLMGLSNVGVDIGALLAGLGVGGIAVALAAQNVLGDLLASLAIVLDKPFVIGDSIALGDIKGSIENIGIKTTRIRSSTGEQIIVANKDLLESRIKNFKRMEQRRVVKNFGVVYSTAESNLKKIPDWIEEIVSSENLATFELCRLANFGVSFLDFEFIFHVNHPDYKVYMETQEKILLSIVKKFAVEGVEFAYTVPSSIFDKQTKK